MIQVFEGDTQIKILIWDKDVTVDGCTVNKNESEFKGVVSNGTVSDACCCVSLVNGHIRTRLASTQQNMESNLGYKEYYHTRQTGTYTLEYNSITKDVKFLTNNVVQRSNP